MAMVRPLRIAVPSDSLPLTGAAFAQSAVVKNGANGLNIPNLQAVAGSPGFYQSPNWVLAQGFDTFSLVAWPGGGLEVFVIPVSVVDTTRELDAVSLGLLEFGSGYVRVTQTIPNLFGFYLRFLGVGGAATTINEVLELQLSKS